MGYHPQMIDSGRFTNDSMGRYVGNQTVKKIIAAHKSPNESRVLIMGITFKENVTDIRNSKVIDVVDELRDFGVEVDIIDPGASQEEVKHEYGITLKEQPSGRYDAIIIAVSHKEYVDLDEKYFLDLLNERGILVDLKGLYRNKTKWPIYWSL
jgi:UDP-N-acetyl-D-galactosamine dehydrogenase